MTKPDALVDTSAAIALIVSSHEAHAATIEALDGRILGLAGHAWFETFSVLTRLPPPARRHQSEVVAILEHNFPESRFLPEDATAGLASDLRLMDIAGGAIYDALVGAAAAYHQIPLVTRDMRAIQTYNTVNAPIELIAE